MANFPTHIAVGTLVSGTLATATLAADVVAPENLVLVTMAGVLGSVMPDIDLKDSRPARAFFSGLAVFFSFAALFIVGYKLSIVEMWLLLIGTFLAIRFGARYIFHRMSYHRGIYHSILAALFFAFATAVVVNLMGRHPGVAWLAGGFMFVGYLVHLTLDEIYSVDVMDTRIKASFGTAMKLWDGRHPGHSIAMAAAAAVALYLCPSPATFVNGISSHSMWASLHRRLLPRDNVWFGFDVNARRFAGLHPSDASVADGPVPEGTSPISTGSIK